MKDRRAVFALLLASLGPACAAAAPPEPACPCQPGSARYYVLIFGGFAVKNRPQTAHTWATFVRAEPAADGAQRLDKFTISWLPVTGRVRPYALRAEPGRNYSLAETMEYMKTGAQELSVWGPFEIRADWYESAARYKGVLDSGAILYRTLDRYDRGRIDVNHCVHAVVLTDDRLHAASDPVTWYGELITRKVAAAAVAAGLLVESPDSHDWLFAPLGLADDLSHLQRRRTDEPVRRFFR